MLRALRGKNVTRTHGLAQSLEQLEAEPPEFSKEVAEFIDSLVGHYVLDEGKLVVAHAGLPERMQGRASGAVRAVALYGDTTGETDEYGLPVRYPWAEDYRGSAFVVYGHTPVPEAVWVNKTICIDTGCVFGGRLSALRYPERELVSVPAHEVYYEPTRPLGPAEPVADDRGPGDLDLEDVIGKRIIETRMTTSITIKEENAVAALEVMSRFAVDPRWLVYLPPTMSPTATSDREGLLEHPHEAFAAYRAGGVEQVMCEEKHMGSRAVVVVCRDSEVATSAFWHRVGHGRSNLHSYRSPLFLRSTDGGHVPRPNSPWNHRLGHLGSSEPTGWCSTANCFPGQLRRANCSDGSTHPSELQRRPRPELRPQCWTPLRLEESISEP